MKLVTCPYCGFRNFEISAYCGRCERPLKATGEAATGEAATGEAATGEAAAGKATTGENPPTVGPPARDEFVPPEAPPKTPPPRDGNALRRVPAPAPPVLETPRPAPLPIDPNNPQAPGPAPVRVDTGMEAEALVTLILPSGWRLALAYAVDAWVVMAAGTVVALAVGALSSTPWVERPMLFLDRLAQWIHLYPAASITGVVITAIIGLVFATVVARQGGRTPGRMLSGTVLVHRSGHVLSWLLVTARGLLCAVSVAVFGAGFFWALVDARGRTWHDILCGTVVVRRKL